MSESGLGPGARGVHGRLVGVRGGKVVDRVALDDHESTHFPVRAARYGLIAIAGVILVVSAVQLIGLPKPPT